ncbi:MAG: YheU family protein [Myxococcales bacterium]|nr:YheU family protein [Myxococcales bacterium]
MSDEESPVHVPYQRLAPATLRTLAEDFCTRDGTDYAEQEWSLDQKVALLMRQLEGGAAHILFEAHSQSLRIVTEDSLPD